MSIPKLLDIGSNLNDPVFRGWYHGKQSHANDFSHILARAKRAGVVCQLLTGDRLEGAKEVIELSKLHKSLFATVGCHPCRADEFNDYAEGPAAYLKAMATLIEEDQASGKDRLILAVGECGLDYDRLENCSKEVQLKYFPPQLDLATTYDLPLFLHSRAAHIHFINILKAHNAKSDRPLRGVVHSHSGSLKEAEELIELGFKIGINGCSLKTQENLACVKALPLTSLLLESDCPWCEIRPSHASHPLLKTLATSPEYSHLKPLYAIETIKKERWTTGKGVKGRNEPCATGLVAWVVAELKGISLEEVTEVCWKNSLELFGIKESQLGLEENEGDQVDIIEVVEKKSVEIVNGASKIEQN